MIKRRPSGYPSLVMPDDPLQLEAVFGLEHATEREQAVLESYRDPIAQAVFLLSVRCLAHLGYLPSLEAVPSGILAYVGAQVETAIPLRYFRDRPARRTEILTAARTVIDYQRWSADHEVTLRSLLVSLALDFPREADLVIAAVERLREWRIELPAEETLISMVESVLQQVEDDTYAEAMRQADTTLRAAITALLEHPESQDTLLEMIKRPAGKPGVRSMRREADKLVALANLGISTTVLSTLGERKLTFLAEQAHRYTAADLRALSDQRRTLILVAFVIRSQQRSRDTLLVQFDKIMRRLLRTSGDQEDTAVLQREKQTAYPRTLSTKILSIIALSPPGTVEERLFAVMPQDAYRRIYATVSGEDERVAYQSARASLLRRFRSHYRKMVPVLLTHITFQAQSPHGKELVATLNLLRDHLVNRHQFLMLPNRPWFLSVDWDQETIIPDTARRSFQRSPTRPPQIRVARHPLEFQTLLALHGALRSGMVWIEGSERYANLATQLVAWDEPTRVQLSAKHRFPTTATAFTDQGLNAARPGLWQRTFVRF